MKLLKIITFLFISLLVVVSCEDSPNVSEDPSIDAQFSNASIQFIGESSGFDMYTLHLYTAGLVFEDNFTEFTGTGDYLTLGFAVESGAAYTDTDLSVSGVYYEALSPETNTASDYTYKFTSGTLEITENATGGYTIATTLAVADGNEVSVNYTGTIEIEAQPRLDSSFTWGDMYVWTSDEYYTYYDIVLLEDDFYISETDELVGQGDAIILTMAVPYGSDIYDVEHQVAGYAFYRDIDFSVDAVEPEFYIIGGTITLSEAGDGNVVLRSALLTDGGEQFAFNYEGPLALPVEENIEFAHAYMFKYSEDGIDGYELYLTSEGLEIDLTSESIFEGVGDLLMMSFSTEQNISPYNQTFTVGEGGAVLVTDYSYNASTNLESYSDMFIASYGTLNLDENTDETVSISFSGMSDEGLPMDYSYDGGMEAYSLSKKVVRLQKETFLSKKSKSLKRNLYRFLKR